MRFLAIFAGIQAKKERILKNPLKIFENQLQTI